MSELQRRMPKEGDVYKHFKGMTVTICGVATHTENEEPLVVYYHDNKLWARPLDMFLSEVDHKKYPQVKQRYRLERIVPYNIQESFEFKQLMEEYSNIPPYMDYSKKDLEEYVLEHFFI